jgi:hypothetical protein
MCEVCIISDRAMYSISPSSRETPPFLAFEIRMQLKKYKKAFVRFQIE